MTFASGFHMWDLTVARRKLFSLAAAPVYFASEQVVPTGERELPQGWRSLLGSRSRECDPQDNPRLEPFDGGSNHRVVVQTRWEILRGRFSGCLQSDRTEHKKRWALQCPGLSGRNDVAPRPPCSLSLACSFCFRSRSRFAFGSSLGVVYRVQERTGGPTTELFRLLRPSSVVVGLGALFYHLSAQVSSPFQPYGSKQHHQYFTRMSHSRELGFGLFL